MVSAGLNRTCRALAVLVLAACASEPSAPATPMSEACGSGTLVEAESSAFCVYRRDSPLVIEGGFQCPARFEFRIDMASAIACGNRALRLEALPRPVCQELGEDCELAQLAGLQPVERVGGPGECVIACETVADCVIPGAPATHDEDNFACVDGACRRTGCNDDDECAAAIPEPETVCRPSLLEPPYCQDACETVDDCLTDRESERDSQIDCVDGACTFVGCTSDEQCHAPGKCVDVRHGFRDCRFLCEAPADCAAAEQEELGLDAPDPNDPWTQTPMWLCREGVCEAKEPGCEDDDDCTSGGVCKLPE